MIIEQNRYLSSKENSVQGRYVIQEQIEEFLKKKASRFEVRTEGASVQNRSIKSITFGKGDKKILMWSQMHGNESTTTKAVLDLINYLDLELEFEPAEQTDLDRQKGSGTGKILIPQLGASKSKDLISLEATTVLENCRITIIPMLNPDGAAAYTRVNANEVDLNRDAADRTQPESVILREVFNRFQPDFCFNLHDQRTIFNVGDTAKPATVSFLAPAYDAERSVSPSRLESMQLIAAMNHQLQTKISGQVGRYDDAFNPNCVGDAFQMTDTPTVLFEAGHHPEDYQRERTREYIFYALTTALQAIGENAHFRFNESDYLQIPENQKRFLDVIIENAHVLNPTLEIGTAIGVLYKEVLDNDRILFNPKIEKTGDLKGYFGHQIYNCMISNDLDAVKRHPALFELLSKS
ncbi:MAG: M14 family zinc carboxypeptidase [Pricia sp.]